MRKLARGRPCRAAASLEQFSEKTYATESFLISVRLPADPSPAPGLQRCRACRGARARARPGAAPALRPDVGALAAPPLRRRTMQAAQTKIVSKPSRIRTVRTGMASDKVNRMQRMRKIYFGLSTSRTLLAACRATRCRSVSASGSVPSKAVAHLNSKELLTQDSPLSLQDTGSVSPRRGSASAPRLQRQKADSRAWSLQHEGSSVSY